MKVKIVDIALNTIKTKGIIGFYAGVSAPIVVAPLSSAATFWGNELGLSFISSLVAKPESALSYPQIFLAGMFSAIPETVTGNTIELIKVKMQLTQAKKPSLLKEFINLYQGGLRPAFRGIVPLFLKNACGNAFYFSAIHAYESRYPHKGNAAVAGAIAGAIAMIANNPLDVVNIKIKASSDPAFKLWTAARAIYQEDGLLGFWKGCSPRVLRAVPGGVIMYSTYRFAMSCLSDS